VEMSEKDEQMEYLNSLVDHYNKSRFWETYVKKTGDIIVPKLAGKTVLEMGCSTLIVSKMIAAVALKFDIVEGAENFTRNAREHFKDTVMVYHSLFEDFVPPYCYDAIVLTNTLHHLNDASGILMRLKGWLRPGGSVYITVPNMFSLHRRIGVVMGLLPDLSASTDRNILFGQPGRYTKENLVELLSTCGFLVKELYGYFLKPFSDDQMALLQPSDALINALFELGKQFEDIASLLYAEAEVRV
jgi:2-polyprenyl-3-methyl-5-hydroxy-6-metoxy-1,4-benzoquinol methylase